MFNCIESDALMDVCLALRLCQYELRKGDAFTDIAIIYDTAPVSLEALLEDGGPVTAYRLSDYLLATAPVDVKEV